MDVNLEIRFLKKKQTVEGAAGKQDEWWVLREAVVWGHCDVEGYREDTIIDSRGQKPLLNDKKKSRIKGKEQYMRIEEKPDK